MKDYVVTLTSDASNSYRCQRAANSLQIDIAAKLRHDFRVCADLETDFHIGLIVGASGSGKTTLARSIYGDDSMRERLDLARPIIEQFPDAWSYDDCAGALIGVGLSQVPCWIRPAHTLSTGQRARAEFALQMALDADCIVMDEWTSVVDRTVAKAMSHTIQRYARKRGKSAVLLSCHYDVIEWLAPDWIIDCNQQTFADRRLLRRSRQERLQFSIRRCDRSAWRNFSRYHYLSERLAGGFGIYYGLFCGDDQIGFHAFSNLVPRKAGQPMILHANRTVIHPDYVGFGMGMKLVNITSKIVCDMGYRVMSKHSSAPIFAHQSRYKCWRQTNSGVDHKVERGVSMGRKTAFRLDVRYYCFEFVPELFTIEDDMHMAGPSLLDHAKQYAVSIGEN